MDNYYIISLEDMDNYCGERERN